MNKAEYPYSQDLQKVASNMIKGNFGLWYNKFIPIKDFDSCKASDEEGEETNVVSFYYEKYKKFQKETVVNSLLVKRHQDQKAFCFALSSGYECLVFKAKLKTPLITGIGESHPHEVSMVFDHNMGIPYIPASGIKGIVRFAHTLGLCKNIPEGMIEKDKEGHEYFEDEEKWTYISQLFGTRENRGSVIFLDSYPEKMPDLHVDIMNPHYGDYYSDDTNKTPPADYLNPVPIKFLTVARETVFIFRVLIVKKETELINKVKDAYTKALTEEGIGAKTAVGYGLFQLVDGEKNAGKKSAENSPTTNALDPIFWDSAFISYAKNTGDIIASFDNKKAISRDKSIIPDPLLEKLKKKSIKAKVEVVPYGNSFNLIRIIEVLH